MTPTELAPRFFIAVAVILVFCKAVAWLLGRAGQPSGNTNSWLIPNLAAGTAFTNLYGRTAAVDAGNTRSVTEEVRGAYAQFDMNGHIGDRVDGIVREDEVQAFRRHQRGVLLDEAGFRLRQNAAEVLAGQRLQLDADRQAALQLGQKVGRLGDVECAGRNEKDVVGLHRAVLCGHGRALDQRQQIALHAFA